MISWETGLAKPDWIRPNFFDIESTFPTGVIPGFGNDDPYKYQQSWAPTFGTVGFDTDAEAAYTITLTLIPKTFKGAPLSVTVVANAVDFGS